MFLLSLSLFLDVGKTVIKYARQAHYNDPWILMASFLIDNYRHWHTELRRKKKTRGKTLAANDIQHAEHVICMMTTGNFNEALVFFFLPRKPVWKADEMSKVLLVFIPPPITPVPLSLNMQFCIKKKR